jgi:hypothetical protein
MILSPRDETRPDLSFGIALDSTKLEVLRRLAEGAHLGPANAGPRRCSEAWRDGARTGLSLLAQLRISKECDQIGR